MAQSVVIEPHITVGDLADKLQLPATRLIGELMKNGILATINERIDADTAQIIVAELGLDVELKTADDQPTASVERPKLAVSNTAVVRPPVVAVMGHVDHGKTSLLDAIRGASVASGEAGGITQHISAYQITHSERIITLLDTPGHEAFAALRQHGARLTDLAVIVVAADDGVKPQTLETIRFAREAELNVIVAITKVDKPGADSNRVKQQLTEHNILVEGWGGDVVAVEVSAKTRQGIDQLLDMILLVADMAELKAETDRPAEGLIIEAYQQQGRGPVAVALVADGTLHAGDTVVAGSTYARIRNLESTDHQPLQTATASTPVIITGFKSLPNFADEFEVVASDKLAKEMTQTRAQSGQTANTYQSIGSNELIQAINRSRQLSQLNVILKADVQGSLTSVTDSLKTLNTEEVAIRIVSSGIGTITENDIHVARSSQALIYGFRVNLSPAIKQLARRDQVSVRLFEVIYELLDDAKKELGNLLAPKVTETETARLLVKAIFKTSKNEVICGGEVTKGRIHLPALARVMHDKDVLGEVTITNLQREKQEVKEVLEGQLCGLSFESSSRINLAEGDRLEIFTRTTSTRSL